MSQLNSQLWEMNSKFCGDSESQSPKKLPRVTIVIHGIHDSEQVKELNALIRSLRDNQDKHPLDIIAITTPELLHQVYGNNHSIMRYIHTLAVSAAEMVSYSADPLPLRWFNQVFNYRVL